MTDLPSMAREFARKNADTWREDDLENLVLLLRAAQAKALREAGEYASTQSREYAQASVSARKGEDIYRLEQNAGAWGSASVYLRRRAEEVERG